MILVVQVIDLVLLKRGNGLVALKAGEIADAVSIGDLDGFPLAYLLYEIDDDNVETEIVGLCAPLI